VLGRADKFVIPSETTRPMSILPPHCAYLLSRWRPRHWSARHRPTVAPSALVLRPQVVWLPYTAARSREDFSCRGFRNAGIVFSFYHAQANVPKWTFDGSVGEPFTPAGRTARRSPRSFPALQFGIADFLSYGRSR